MDTVNFQCGHCGNLMAVGTDNLGQQVRCPHCQQVVVAPPPTPAPAPAPGAAETTFQPTLPQDHEDIFAPPPTEDLFDAPRLPTLEMPPPGPAPAPPAPNGPPAGPALTLPDEPRPGAPGPGGETTLPFLPGAAPPPGEEATLPLRSAAPGPHWMEPTLADAPPLPAPPAAGADAPAGDLAAAIPRPARKPSGGGGWFIPVIFVPLLVYAVLVTITAVVFWNRLQQAPPDPFDAMPDVDGDTPGVRKDGKGGKARSTLSYDRDLATAPLPAHLVTALGKPLRVGDLEVTPTKVERRRVRVFVSGFDQPEPCEGDSLVLHLRLRNLAKGYAFTPLDNYFDRWWRPPGGLPPLTLLEAGKDRFYGGPAHWYPRGSRNAGKREWVEGRKDFDPDGLAPGAEQESFVCTDGSDPHALRVLFGAGRPAPYRGPLLWRVQVRRGLYEYRGRRVPAEAVVGVAFDSRDVADAG